MDKNLYAYCDNNPIMRDDAGGEFWNAIAGAAMGAGISLAVEATTQFIEINITKTRSSYDKTELIIAGVSGLLSGALTGSGIPAGRKDVLETVLSGATELYSQIESGNRDVQSIAINVGVEMFISGVGGRKKGKDTLGSDYKRSVRNHKTAKAKFAKKPSKRNLGKVYKTTKKRNILRKQVRNKRAVSYFWGTVSSTVRGRVKKLFGW